MGNRAVITASLSNDPQTSNDIGIYLHWNGGRDSVEAFLEYCKRRGFRPPDQDNNCLSLKHITHPTRQLE